MVLTVRAASDPLQLAPALRDAVLEIDPAQPVSRVTSMAQYLSDAVETPRLSALVLALFGATALLFAAVGIYGVISFSATRRTRDWNTHRARGCQARCHADGGREAVTVTSVGVALGIGVAPCRADQPVSCITA